MLKRAGIPDGIPQTMPVLDVTSEVGNPRVEDVAKRILSKEEVT
jgi:hypothetical protein